MVLKTRDRLIEVARQLFLMKGIENTTMIDIANASENGRRTVYTYFKNKSDIYNAVIERESDFHVSGLRQIAESQLPPEEKLEKYLKLHFDMIHEDIFSHDSISAWLRLDFSRSDKIRQAVYNKETDILDSILREGVRDGIFDSEASHRLLKVLPSMLQALSRQTLNHEKSNHSGSALSTDAFVDFIIHSVTVH